MATPKDAPYKVEQRNLRRRAAAMPRAQFLVDNRGEIRSQKRGTRRAVFIAANGVRQWKRLQQSVRRLFPQAVAA